MTASSQPDSAAGINPYSPTAVALVTELSEAPITVSTGAVVEAYAELDDYLDAPAPATGRRQGGVLTILGEYGSGKTHLAAALWRRAGSVVPPAHSVYLDAPADTFVRLYQRFAGLLNRYDLLEVLRDYYADVVADDLAGIPGTEDIARRLRGGEIDPADVVQQLELMGSALLQRLQDELIQATSQPDLATALTLLFEPTLASAAWDWLAGNRPNEYLQERGILRQIDNDTAALDAIVAFAALYGYRKLRFVLIVDELDRVLAAVSQVGAESVGAFRRALTAFEQAGGFVVLVGQTDIQQTLGDEVLQRMGHIIAMPAMSPQNVIEFVKKSHTIARGDDGLHPFSAETLSYLTEITQGIPRQVIKLAHFLYARYQHDGTPITIETVRSVARSHFDIASTADVRYEIPQVLRREGILFARGHVTDDQGRTLVDFWVLRPDGALRCAVLVSGSLLTTADVNDINARVTAARLDDVTVDVVLVVVGYLSEDAKAGLETIRDIDYFVYYRRSFADEFAGAVSASLVRLDSLEVTDDLPVIRERVERIARQEASLHGLVERLATQMLNAVESTERQLTAMRREITDVSIRMPGETAPAPGEETPATQLPALLARTEELFEPALSSLAELDRIENVLTDALNPDPEQSDIMTESRMVIRAVLQQQDGLSPLGAANFLRKLVQSFRMAIKQWYWYSDARTMGELSAGDRGRLDSLCYNYDAVFQYVPMFQLKRLAESSARASSYGSLAAVPWQAAHLDDIREKFENLSVRVRATVLEKSAADPTA